MDKLSKMGARKILTDAGWQDADLVSLVQELLLALGMDEGLPWTTINTDNYNLEQGVIEDEHVVQCLLELAEMVGIQAQVSGESADE